MKWIDAIKKVFEDSDSPLHYKEITDRIINKGYRTNSQLGKTPEMSVSMFLTTNKEIFEKVDDGIYKLIDAGNVINWLISSNDKRFKLSECLFEMGFVDWKQGNYKFKAGDTVFIYCSSPESRIKYITYVDKTNISYEKSFDDKKYWRDENEFKAGQTENRYCRLKLLCEVNTEELSLSNLLKHGLKVAPQSPQKLSKSVLEYITNIINISQVEEQNRNDAKKIENILKNVTEEAFELNPRYYITDSNTGILEKNKLVRYRKLNNSIGENLKKIYDYKCQISGENPSNIYGCNVVEAHHIEYFTKSLNNDSSNIVIISPDFHRIIHALNPVFDRTKLAFIFPNGLEVKLKLNKHL